MRVPIGAVCCSDATAPEEGGIYSAGCGGQPPRYACHSNHSRSPFLKRPIFPTDIHPAREVSRYVVTVAPSDAFGRPIVAEARAFVVGGGRGIVYRCGTWHAGMSVLDRPARFAVLIWSMKMGRKMTSFSIFLRPFRSRRPKG